MAISAIVGLLVTLALLPIAEYLSHRLMMHHECPQVKGVYHRHAVLHHRHNRVDVNIDTPAWYAILIGSPVISGLWLTCGPAAALTSTTVITLYAILWTGLHRAIHGVGGNWAKRLPFYTHLSLHHLAHHAKPGRNYGTVFGPLLDRPMGTHHDGVGRTRDCDHGSRQSSESTP